MPEPNTREMILKCDFLRKTEEGLRLFLEDTDGHDARLDNGTPENWAFLWFQLRLAEDKPGWFPSGKWATIQHLETLLNECARDSIGKKVINNA